MLEHCINVLRLDSRPAVEVRQYFPGGQVRWQTMIASWNLDKRPKPAPVPVAGERYQARYVKYSGSPGYRDVTLLVSLNDDPKAPPVELHFSGEESWAMAKDIVDLHWRAWDCREPIDAKPGEKRPIWL
jgi:hypothetical protein